MKHAATADEARCNSTCTAVSFRMEKSGTWERAGFCAIRATVGSPDKLGGLSIQPCKSEKEEPYIRHSSQGRSECLYLRIE